MDRVGVLVHHFDDAFLEVGFWQIVGPLVGGGQVDLRAGLYQIVVNNFEGELLAEIKDRNGALIGEDRRELVGLKQAGTIFQGPALKLGKPSSFAFNPRSADENKKQDSDTGVLASLFSGNYDLKNTNNRFNEVSIPISVGMDPVN